MSSSAIKTTLDKIIDIHGTDIITDGERVVSLFADMCPGRGSEQRKIRTAYELNIVQMLYGCGKSSADSACNRAISVLKEEAFMDERAARALVYDIADALCLNYNPISQPEPVEELETEPDEAEDEYSAETNEVNEDETNDRFCAWLRSRGEKYSSNEDYVHPYRVVSDLKDLSIMEFGADGIPSAIKDMLKEKEAIAKELWETGGICDVYDYGIVEGGMPLKTRLSHFKYNRKRIQELEEEFWS